MYCYETEKPRVFLEENQHAFLALRDRVRALIKEAGAVRLQEAVRQTTGDSWLALAMMDRLVELYEIHEIGYSGDRISQNRVFVAVT